MPQDKRNCTQNAAGRWGDQPLEAVDLHRRQSRAATCSALRILGSVA
jgi:hypothetical protein